MRVLSVGNVYPPHHLGGYEVIWRGVTRHLQAAGHTARVLTTDYRRPGVPPSAPDDPDVHRELGWYWHDHDWPRLPVSQRLALERRNAAVFDRHLQELRPDVVAWWAVGGLSLGLIERARRANLPSVLFVLDPWAAYGPTRDQWIAMWGRRPRTGAIVERLTGLPTRLDLAGAGRWLFCSASIRDETLATGLAIRDWAVLPPGVETSYLDVPREREPPPWGWRLLYVGRVVEQKGVRTAIESLPLLAPEATLRIVGDGDEPYRRELESLASRLGVAARVSIEPARPREELVEVYRSADVVVFPVRWNEPWGLVPLEAMALGRVVVATGRGGSGDYLVDGSNSLLFGGAEADELAARLHAVAGDPALRERLRRGGYETAAAHSEEHFNRSATAELESAAGLG